MCKLVLECLLHSSELLLKAALMALVFNRDVLIRVVELPVVSWWRRLLGSKVGPTEFTHLIIKLSLKLHRHLLALGCLIALHDAVEVLQHVY